MPSSIAEPALDALPASEASAEELYEDAPCGYLSLRPDGVVVRVNRTLLRSLGRGADEVVGRPLQEFLAPGSRIYHATHWGPKLELEGEVHEVPVDLVRADASRLTTLLSAVVTRDRDGMPVAIRASLFDATDRRRYERELLGRADQQAVVARLGTRALEGVPVSALLDEATDALRLSVAADDVTIVLSGDDRPADVRGEHTLRVPIGAPAEPFGTLLLATADAEFSPGDTSFVESVANVLGTAMERRRIDDATRHRALHDSMTGLPNRVLLHDRLAAVIDRVRVSGAPFSLCLLDLDDFKLVNDTRGHPAGDELLRHVARRLSGVVRQGDTVARLGGDEFVVLSGEAAGGAPGAALAQRVIEAIREPFILDGAEYTVRASVGVVTGDGASDPEGMLRDADVAMYRAKERGRGQYAHFDASMRRRTQERVRVEAELRVALREGQLRVYYQPVVHAATGRVASMEALVRWEHPERGLVSPGDFIGVAEDSGLVIDLGRHVLEEACRQLAEWRASGEIGADVGVAVNVCARQLLDPGFPDEVAGVLRGCGLADTPWLVGLEITETILMSGESPGEVLDRLAATGVGLLLDDFGTGASSLARLKRFPVDTLKIDRAFVSSLGEGDGTDDAIVAAVMALARALDLKVVAEGVETLDQLERMRALGCERIQGYFFSKPVPAAEMVALLRRERLPARYRRRQAGGPDARSSAAGPRAASRPGQTSAT